MEVTDKTILSKGTWYGDLLQLKCIHLNNRQQKSVIKTHLYIKYHYHITVLWWWWMLFSVLPLHAMILVSLYLRTWCLWHSFLFGLRLVVRVAQHKAHPYPAASVCIIPSLPALFSIAPSTAREWTFNYIFDQHTQPALITGSQPHPHGMEIW